MKILYTNYQIQGKSPCKSPSVVHRLREIPPPRSLRRYLKKVRRKNELSFALKEWREEQAQLDDYLDQLDDTLYREWLDSLEDPPEVCEDYDDYCTYDIADDGLVNPEAYAFDLDMY